LGNQRIWRMQREDVEGDIAVLYSPLRMDSSSAQGLTRMGRFLPTMEAM
jgi:hypothetical protein